MWGGTFIWCRYPWKPEAMDTPRAGFGEGCELPDTGVRNWTWALCETVCTLNHWVISTVLAMIVFQIKQHRKYLFWPGLRTKEGGVNSGQAVPAPLENALWFTAFLIRNGSYSECQHRAHLTGGLAPGFEMLRAGLFWMLESFNCDSSNFQILKGCSFFYIRLDIFMMG